MDKIRKQFDDGRRNMIDAFKDLITLANRAGCDWGAESEIQGRFWDGHVEIKYAFTGLEFAAEFGLRPAKRRATAMPSQDDMLDAMIADRETLAILAPIAQCGHCHYGNALAGTWSVEDGRLVFRADANPLTRRGPEFDSCCESDPVIHFKRITVDTAAGEVALTDGQVAELRASAEAAFDG